MNTSEPEKGAPTPIRIIQPCTEACTCFKRLVGNGWMDFGICANPNSPHQGSPVQIGRECSNYQSSENGQSS